MQEKRRFTRIPDNLKISYQVVTTAKVGDYVTKDIGQGGVRFFLHEFVPRGSLLRINVTFEKTHFSFESMVKVVWVRDDSITQRYEAGVEFVDMPPEASQYLTKHIKAFFEGEGKF